ncbi:pyridoxamine 5'-phosphate oxidase family protein [Aquimarina celericrescens]|uniref:Pyridoxamine 5'-phosphate oxidase family protein n=1 Tax=Aquimarina celericrescens TaxID=1964542 RepID=A0ABW5AUW6_9FLAO|nr:pyridoxamine 5'-phosphate oxidase family protein [Aquimarina celericrescens]
MIKKLDKKESVQILSNNYIGYLAFISQDSPYIVPITYYYDKDNITTISYSGMGHKIEAMRKNDAVSMIVDEIESLSNWKSVLIQGRFEELTGTDARYLLHEFSEGVKKIIRRKEKKSPQFIDEFSSKISSENIPIVYRIKIDEITGKQRDS